MTATEIRNTLGIYDWDELNAACECERKENLATEIAQAIVRFHGVKKLYGVVLRFSWIKEVLKNFGFDYVRADEENESHFFFNKETGDEIDIYPTCFYVQQDAIRISNFHLF